MHLNTCCALLLLAFVACQAAPSPKITDKNSIAETGAEAKNTMILEDAGADKDRAKKSATTFCVEVRSEKEEQEPKPVTILQSMPAPQLAPTSLTIVQPAPAPAPAPLILQPAPAPVPLPTPVTIVQPAATPCTQELSMNIVQPAPPHMETVYVHPAQPAPQPQIANIMLPSLPAPQPAPQIVLPAPQPAPAPVPTQYVNILPPTAPAPCPQQSTYVVQTQPAPQPIPSLHLVQQQPLPAPQPAVTWCQQEPMRFEQELRPMKQLQVVPEYVQHHEDVFQCNCRPESHLKSKHLQRITLPASASLGPKPFKNVMLATQNEPASLTPVYASQAREAEARHFHKHNQKILLTPSLDYSIVQHPPIVTPYYGYNSYQSYPMTGYNPNGAYSYPYGNIPSVTVNAGGPFLGQPQSGDAQTNSELPSVVSEVNDLTNNQKREAKFTNLKNDEQNEIIQQAGKNRVIKEANADTIKIGGTK